MARGVPDLLKVEDEAHAVARLCTNRAIDPPLAIGVFGEWGTGKTFFMEKVYEAVEAIREEAARRRALSESANAKDDLENAAETTAFERYFYSEGVVQIRFNAWHYIETNLWASLVDHIFTELDSWLQGRTSGSDDEEQAERVEELFEQLSTSQELKFEAVVELIEARRRRAAAIATLDQRYRECAAARSEERRENERLVDWPLIWAAFQRSIEEGTEEEDGELRDEVKRLDQLAKKLGVESLSKNARELHETIERAGTGVGRIGLHLQGIGVLIGSPWVAIAVVAGVLGLPLLAVLMSLLEKAADSSVGSSIKAMTVGFASVVGTVSTLATVAYRRVAQGLSTVVKFRNHLEAAIAAERNGRLELRAVAQRRVEQCEAEAENAEAALARAEAAEVQATQDFNWGRARQRLAAFIRDKVVDGEYAKHLGIIASIRRDFGELARLMRAVGVEDQLRRETADDIEALRRKKDQARRVVERMEDVLRDYEQRVSAYLARFEKIVGKAPSETEIPPPGGSEEIGGPVSPRGGERLTGENAGDPSGSREFDPPLRMLKKQRLSYRRAMERVLRPLLSFVGREERHEGETGSGPAEDRASGDADGADSIDWSNAEVRPLLDPQEVERCTRGLVPTAAIAARRRSESVVKEIQPLSFDRILLYIDDLDRCPPKKVVEVLQAIHLLLGFPLFVVLVAVDERWVSRALASEYPGLLRENGALRGK